MRNLMLVGVLALGLGACGGNKLDEVLGELESFKNKMCACTDKACVDKVQEDWRAYRKTMKEKVGKDTKPSESQEKKGRALDDEMRACRKKFDGDSSGNPAPTGETPPAPAPAGDKPATP